MISMRFGRVTLFALAASLAGGALVSCSSSSDKPLVGEETLGKLDLHLSVGDDRHVSSVEATISGNGITPIVRTIQIGDDPVARATILVGGLPAGSGYSVKMTATTDDGTTTCEGEAAFSILAGQTTQVTVQLQCMMPDNTGEVIAEGDFNKCPMLTRYTVAPLQASAPSGKIDLTAAASDEDDDDVLSFSWTASAGTVSPMNAADATYTCSQAGNNTLTLTVSDGECEDTASVVVSCIAVACGNGTVDPGETCDDGNTVGGDGCPADCTLPVCGDGLVEEAETCDDGNTTGGDACPADCTLPICGDGVTEAPETCDDGNTVDGDACPADCTLAVCGDGKLESPETCEPPNTPTCDAQCQTAEAPPVCGDGEVTGNEQCEPPSQENCGLDCSGVSTAACLTCENGNDCAPLVNGCDFYEGQVAQAGPAAGVSMEQLCFETIQCQRESGCGSVGGAIDCYCGTADGASCLSGAANGPCKTEIERSLESIDPPTVAGRFGNTAFAGGAALLRTQCDFALCNPVCFEGRPTSSNP